MSHKHIQAVMAGAMLLMLGAGAQAQLIVSDGFNDAPGAITGDGGGVGWANNWTSGSTTNPDQVTSGGLTYSQDGIALATSENKLSMAGDGIGAYRRLPTADGSYGGDVNQDVWISFLAQDTAGGATSGGNAGLLLYEDNVGETLFIGAQPDPNSAAGAEEYGFTNPGAPTESGSGDIELAGVAPSTATDFLVAHLSFTASGSTEVTLYIDPVPGETTTDPYGDVVPVGYTDSVVEDYENGFEFDEFGLSSGPDASPFNFDEIRAGDTYLDVAPAAAPEPGEIVPLAIGASSLLVMALGARRKRRTMRSSGR
jgi:hypothetical protein